MKKFPLAAALAILLMTAGLGVAQPDPETSPYLIGSSPEVKTRAILSAGETVANGYRMAGIPDGLGAFDNDDGTFTLLMNHELDGKAGKLHAHGATGAFISRWVITKPGNAKGDFQVLSGEDAIDSVFLWDPRTYRYQPAQAEVFSNFCSGDLARPTAFYDPDSKLGTKDRIYLNGEELDGNRSARYGRAFATIVTGSHKGEAYELPIMGKMSFENILASPHPQRKTVAIALDDAMAQTPDTLGEVYVYVGQKQETGSPLEQAGLTNGKLYGISVDNLPVESPDNGLNEFTQPSARFRLIELGNLSRDDGSILFGMTTARNDLGITKFFRPEDGAWHPKQAGLFYFVTTGAKVTDPQTKITMQAPGRLWALHFDNIKEPTMGGWIELVLNGSEGMLGPDNITVTEDDKVYIQEDFDGEHLCKIWEYDPVTGKLREVLHHNPDIFKTGSPQFLTSHEESSGIIDVETILGQGWFLADVQAHVKPAEIAEDRRPKRWGTDEKHWNEIVEDGQLLLLRIPDETSEEAVRAQSGETLK